MTGWMALAARSALGLLLGALAWGLSRSYVQLSGGEALLVDAPELVEVGRTGFADAQHHAILEECRDPSLRSGFRLRAQTPAKRLNLDPA